MGIFSEVQATHEHNSFVDTDLHVILEIFAAPGAFVNSAKGTVFI